ncbi:bicaudal-D-related protein 2-like [Cololabis saira]|uniref:bicaudal-D-related protein 2-like n=1 Tax=Cololabis saira TaxID=129043 RepID=UPI002AD3505A|nr:bicaudal-D-related protein 2-like [Cololabis saira]
MDYSQPFSLLNEKLRPRFTSSEKLYSSLSRVEDRQLGSPRYRSSYQRPTVLQTDLEPQLSMAEADDPGSEPEDHAGQEDLVGDDNAADLLPIEDLNLKDVPEEVLDKEDSTQCEETDGPGPGELSSEESKPAAAGEEGSPLQARYMDGTLPDLLKSGRPLSRRRTLGHYSDTIKEVRREVELSRKRSIRLKAQVDKLQESREGPGWSQHREQVTEEVLSILRLLHPLTEPESSRPEPRGGENRLDAALSQLQHVARSLAISHTTKDFKSPRGGGDDGAILQQALRDRDEAVEKKKAMEAEVLRSKTEMMTLNNHLLEAAQKRLELSLELEAWKEDFQLLLQQQLQIQQQAEQAQKKPSRLGILKRSKPATQRPPHIPVPAAPSPSTSSSQIFLTKSSDRATQSSSTPPTSGTRTWKTWDRLKKSKSHYQDTTEQDSAGRRDDGFQVVALD